MRTERQIQLLRQVARHVFGLTPQSQSGRPNDGTLAFSGFPELRERIALPAAAVWSDLLRVGSDQDGGSGDSWRPPHICCVSRGPVARMLPQHPQVVAQWQGTGFASIEWPHSPSEGVVGVARFVAAKLDFGAAVPAIWLVGRDIDFIEETAAGLEAGEPLPPWRIYPDAEPDSETWEFGHGATWMRRAWQPFWGGPLSKEERDEYQRRWEVPESWLRHLS